jgi:hypothetical protein
MSTPTQRRHRQTFWRNYTKIHNDVSPAIVAQYTDHTHTCQGCGTAYACRHLHQSMTGLPVKNPVLLCAACHVRYFDDEDPAFQQRVRTARGLA